MGTASTALTTPATGSRVKVPQPAAILAWITISATVYWPMP